MFLCCLMNIVFAQNKLGLKANSMAPEPTTCISGVFSKSGSGSWVQVALKITNNCGKSVDFQNASITFSNNINLTTSFWGNFYPLSYPDNVLQITSQPNTSGGFISSLSLHFPEQPWANSILPDKGSIVINYGANNHTPSDVKVYINGTLPTTGQLELTNTTAKPANVTQAYALVDISLNGQKINTVQVPWSGKYLISDLQPAVYTLQPQNVTDTNQNTYEGNAVPATVTVMTNQKVTSTISYRQIMNLGTIKVSTTIMPTELSGYTSTPVVTFRRNDTGATVTRSVPWNATTPISDLANNVVYQVSTPAISYQGVTCVGTFSPSSLTSRADNPLTTQLSYTCSSVTQARVKISVSGLPCEARTTTVTFQPSDGSAAVNKIINVTSGSGSDYLMLTDGVVYNVSASNIVGYSAFFNPQPIMAKPEVTETITYQPVPLRKGQSSRDCAMAQGVSTESRP